MNLAIAVTETSRECANTIAVNKSVGDQPHGTSDDVGTTVPLWRPRRSIGAAALARPITMRLRRGGGTEEVDVLALRCDRRARRPTIDAGRAHSRDEPAIEPRVAALTGPVALVVVEWKHVTIVATARSLH